MTNRKTALWIAASAVVLAAAAGVFVIRNRYAPVLPPERDYSGYPKPFINAMAKARSQVVWGGYAPDDIRTLGRLCQANSYDDDALACFAILRGLPGGLKAKDYYYESDMQAAKGHLDLAVTDLRACIAADPDYLPARLALGDALFKSDRPEESAKVYEEILSRQLGQPQAMFALARIELQGGKDEAAMARLGQLIAAHPDMTSGVALLAQICDRRGEATRAATLRKWSMQQPEPVPPDPWRDELIAYCYNLELLSLQFEQYYTSGEISRALPLLQRVEELDPKSPIPPLLRGWNAARNHDDAAAVQQYREALVMGGDPEKICPYLAQAMMTLGRTAEAAKLLAEYSAKKPDSIPILIAYSQVAFKQGDKELAKALLTKVTTKEPYLTSANLKLATLLWESKDKDGAAACLGRVVEVSPADYASRSLLGAYYVEKKEPDRAIPLLEQALALTKEVPAIHGNVHDMLYMAYVYDGIDETREVKTDAALAHFDKAIQLEPSKPAAYARKAAACAQAGRLPEAIEALERVEALQPANPTVFISLGDVYHVQGKEDEARKAWQKALELAPKSDVRIRDALGERLHGAPAGGILQ